MLQAWIKTGVGRMRELGTRQNGERRGIDKTWGKTELSMGSEQGVLGSLHENMEDCP